MYSDEGKQEHPIYTLGYNNVCRARFFNGVFTPEQGCKKFLTSQVISITPESSRTAGWFGHGSTFIFNHQDQCWDEFDESQQKVTVKWRLEEYFLKSIGKDEQVFTIDGYWKATFPNGKFTPAEHLKQNLQGSVENHSKNYCVVKNWCGHGSVFIYNEEDETWDEYDQSQGKVTCKWRKENLS